MRIEDEMLLLTSIFYLKQDLASKLIKLQSFFGRVENKSCS